LLLELGSIPVRDVEYFKVADGTYIFFWLYLDFIA
jgi:hypothetical protein